MIYWPCVLPGASVLPVGKSAGRAVAVGDGGSEIAPIAVLGVVVTMAALVVAAGLIVAGCVVVALVAITVVVSAEFNQVLNFAFKPSMSTHDCISTSF